MAAWDNVYHGFLNQWMSHWSTWAVFAVALVGAAAVSWYLIRSRWWPAAPTVVALGWACFVVASTWRVRGASVEWQGLWGPEGILRRVVTVHEWSRAVEQVLHGGPFAMANSLLLVPVGLLLMVAARRIWVAVVMSVGLLMLVESQQALARGFIEILDDVVTNLLGAVVGVVIGWLYVRVRHRKARPPLTSSTAPEGAAPS